MPPVHRSTSAGFTPAAATLVGTLTDDAWQSYRDTTAKPSTTFYYRVVTVKDTGGGETAYSSNEVKAALPAAGEATMVLQPGYLDTVAKATHISSGTPTTNYGNSLGVALYSFPPPERQEPEGAGHRQP